MHNRECHYHSYTGERQCWEWSAATGWNRQPDDAVNDWPLNSFRYVDWSHGAPGIPDALIDFRKMAAAAYAEWMGRH